MRRHNYGLQHLIIGTTVPLISLCATFILLYQLMPHTANVPPIVASSLATPVVHDIPKPAVVAPPVQVKIDSINVAAVVNPAGLTSAGDMDIDENPEQTAWYKLGPKPGEEGSAVIAGHYGWKDGVPSVFNNLNKLTKGDIITTLDQNGEAKKFVVTRTALYAPNQDATDVFMSDDGKAHLNLVTCQGTWVNDAKSYTERLVVFTDYVK